jgi:hypothetical protein
MDRHKQDQCSSDARSFKYRGATPYNALSPNRHCQSTRVNVAKAFRRNVSQGMRHCRVIVEKLGIRVPGTLHNAACNSAATLQCLSRWLRDTGPELEQKTANHQRD